MGSSVNPPARTYRAPHREAAAARTREAILAAGTETFVRLGWSGTTMRRVAEEAGVSIKTVEARYGRKSALLKDVVNYAIAGEVVDAPTAPRDSIRAMKAASDAEEMLRLHARHVRTIDERAAGVLWAVEHAAPADEDAAALWAQLLEGRRFGAGWAVRTLFAKPGLPASAREADAEEVFWIAMEPGTYRSLTLGRGLTLDRFEAWVASYYVRMLLS